MNWFARKIFEKVSACHVWVCDEGKLYLTKIQQGLGVEIRSVAAIATDGAPLVQKSTLWPCRGSFILTKYQFYEHTIHEAHGSEAEVVVDAES